MHRIFSLLSILISINLCFYGCADEEDQLLCEHFNVSVYDQPVDNCQVGNNGSIDVSINPVPYQNAIDHSYLDQQHIFIDDIVDVSNNTSIIDELTIDYRGNAYITGLKEGDYTIDISSDLGCKWSQFVSIEFEPPEISDPKVSFFSRTKQMWDSYYPPGLAYIISPEDDYIDMPYSIITGPKNIDIRFTEIVGGHINGEPVTESYFPENEQYECDNYSFQQLNFNWPINQPVLNSHFKIMVELIENNKIINTDSVIVFVQEPTYFGSGGKRDWVKVGEDLLFIDIWREYKYNINTLPEITGIGNDIQYAIYNSNDELFITSSLYIKDNGPVDVSHFDNWNSARFWKTSLTPKQYQDIFSWDKFETYVSLPSNNDLQPIIQINEGDVVYYEIDYIESTSDYTGDGSTPIEFYEVEKSMRGILFIESIQNTNGNAEIVVHYKGNFWW